MVNLNVFEIKPLASSSRYSLFSLRKCIRISISKCYLQRKLKIARFIIKKVT